MAAILAFILENLKPLFIVAMIIIAIWFLFKFEGFKIENAILNNDIQSQDNTIKTQNAIIENINNNPAPDAHGIDELMHENKL